jgi:hypothetical protein
LLIAELGNSSSSRIQSTASAPTAADQAAALAAPAAPVSAAQTSTISKTAVADSVVADTAVPEQSSEPASILAAQLAPVETRVTGMAPISSANSRSAPGEAAKTGTPDPAQSGTEETVRSAQGLDECKGEETCVDQYLWSLYERAPKVDTVKETETKKETVEKNGKTRTITKTTTKLVAENFAWKDPQAAEKAALPLKDYVIGGMDREFKHRLYRALRALDRAGLVPGITSAFRDDYRQSLASGLHAANNRSYHGGSLRGGYGHGLAADVVSVKGDTSAERWAASEQLWKWIDAHGKEFGLGRPYLNKDPGHCAPIDGQEYAVHHAKALAQQTHADSKKKHKPAEHADHKVASTTVTTSHEPQDRAR